MKWICLCAVVCLIGTATALAGETLMSTGGYGGDPSQDPAIPSGLRFAEPAVTVKTGDYGGAAYGGAPYAGVGPCGCGSGRTCAHWTMLPWYVAWPTAHDLYRYERRAARSYAAPGYY
ncbi:MAG TPA: hypothetical protein VHV08_08145 [Pirellulales bacterium]|nr:hypothetical protein [Pirellulales bacterium]